jgi:hypothetical protein
MALVRRLALRVRQTSIDEAGESIQARHPGPHARWS